MQARIQGAVGAVAPQKRHQKKGEKEKEKEKNIDRKREQIKLKN